MRRSLVSVLPFLIVITSILGAIHYFVFAITSPDLSLEGEWALAALLTAGLFSFPVGLFMSHGKWRKTMKPVTLFGYYWLGFFFIVFSFSIVEFFISMLWRHHFSMWPWVAGLLATAWSIFRALSPPRIISYTLQGPAAMRGITLVQLSDVHIGMPFLNQDWLARQVGRINDLNPDFVAITGDLADGPFSEVSPQLAPLADIQAKKFYVTGNHEFIRGGDWETRLRELGFTVLHNTNEIFDGAGGKFLIGGVPDRVIINAGQRFESSPAKALASVTLVDYKILLAHEPKSVFHLDGAKCDLLLSGHVHGGQIFPFGLLVRLAQPMARGFKTINGTLVFAHMGTGYWGPSMRWLTRSEIVRFEWSDQARLPQTFRERHPKLSAFALVLAGLFAVLALWIIDYSNRPCSPFSELGHGRGFSVRYCWAFGFRDGDYDWIEVHRSKNLPWMWTGQEKPLPVREIYSPTAKCDGGACEGLFNSEPLRAIVDADSVQIEFKDGSKDRWSLPKDPGP